MSNLTLKSYLEKPEIQTKFEELLGRKSTNFTTSLMQVVSGNDKLKACNPNSIINAAAMAAVLDLPINDNLGLAYIVPYKDKAQFQIGYKGLIQLAIRSGEFKNISSSEIHENQLKSSDPLKGFEFDFSAPPKGKIVGYASYFLLLNRFEKTFFMTVEQVKAHGKKYSQTFGKSWSTWTKDFDGMAKKTVLKLLVDKYAPKSLEMQKAITSDQAIVEDINGDKLSYADNPENVDTTAEVMDDFKETENENIDFEDDDSVM